MFEVAMHHNNMFSQLEDTEMAVDAGKAVPVEEDIDIDLDFSDHGQDEMMTEEVHVPTYEMVLGDGIVASEQDEDMTDESLEGQIFDEEITDAPVEEAVASAEFDSFPATDFEEPFPTAGFEDKTELIVNEQADAETQEKGIDSGGLETAVEAEESHTVAEVAAEHNPVSENTDEKKTEKAILEEPEELITWESDEEDEEAEPKPGATVEPVGLVPTVSNEKKVREVLEHNTNEGSNDINYTAASNEDAQATADDVFARAAGDDEDQNKAAEESSDGVVQDSATEVGRHIATTESSLAPVTDSTLLEEQALQQLHPMVIRYMDEEMSLFPPTLEGEHTMFFLSEKKLAFDNCENLFKAFRGVLGESINKDETLVLECPDLGLEIHEGIAEASTLSVAQLLHLYLGLSHHDGHEQASPMPFVLKHHYDISARLNHLYALLDSGKGLSAVPGYRAVEHVDAVEEDGEAQDEVEQDEQDEGADNVNESSNTVPEVGLSLNEDDAIVTPAPEDDPEQEFDLDFHSPAVPQRIQGFSAFNASTEAASKANMASAVAEQETTVADGDQSILAQNTVEHDIDGEEETPEGSQPYVQHNGNQSSNSTDLDATQQDTNSANDDTALTTQHTDHSNLIESHDYVTEDNPSKEDHLDLEYTLEERDDTKPHPESDTLTKESTNHGANPGVDQNIANQVHPADVADDFDEIGYSSSEDEIEDLSPSKLTKPSPEALQIAKPHSPKRSIDDLDESTRDTKKLRST